MYNYLLIVISIFALVSTSQAIKGPWFNIVSYRTALTATNAYPNNATFTPITINNDYQSWMIQNGRLVNKAQSMALDVYNNAAFSGNNAITFRFKNASANSTTAASNQIWVVNGNGTIQSLVGTGYWLKNFNQKAVVTTLLPPPTFNFSDPVIGPITCMSHGDPHYARFNGTFFDFQGKGDFLLASWGGNTVQTRQDVCSSGITCNKMIAIKASGLASTIIISNSGAVTVGGSSITVTGTVVLSPIVSITKSGSIFPITYKVSMNLSFVVYTIYSASSTVQVTLTAGAVPDGGLCSEFCPANSTTQQCGLTSLVPASKTLFSGNSINDASYVPTPVPTSTNDPSLQAAATCACRTLGVSNGACGTLARVCDSYAGASQFYSSCAGDIYQTGNIEFGQASVSAYAALCVYNAMQTGVSIVLPTSGFASVASGAGLTSGVVSSQPISFTIQAQDDLGNKITVGGDTFSVTSTGPSSLSFSIVDNNDGTYTVSYVPAAGTYNISVTLCCNDVTGSPFPVTMNTQCSASATQTNLQCDGDSSGSFSITGSGGVTPYSYSLNGNAYGSNNMFNGLQAGSYSWSFQDSNGCSVSGSIVITEPSALAVSSVHSDVACNADSTGSFYLNVTGGVPNYSFSVNGGNYTTSNTWTGLTAGDYSWTVLDSHSCRISGVVTLSQPTALALTIVGAYNETCYGQTNANFTVAASGGTAPYAYSLGNSWRNNGTYVNLAVGTYNVQAMDAASCKIIIPVVVSQPDLLTATASVVSVSCYGASSGSVSISPSGGSAPFMYSLNGSTYSSSATFSSLPAGTYTWNVVDQNQCTTSGSVTITQPSSALVGTVVESDAKCYGSATGSFAVTASGGSPSYQYSVNGGAYGPSSSFSNLTSGTYTFSIMDSTSCVFSGSVAINQPAVLNFGLLSKNDAICYGSTGNFTVMASGGVTPYSYSIGNGWGSNNVFANRPAGTYNAGVQDANSCQVSLSVTIQQPGAVTASAETIAVTCYAGSSGSITVSNTGGAGPFTYSLNGGTAQSSNVFRNLAAGSYSFTAYDKNMCAGSGSAVVTQPAAALAASTVQTNVSCKGASTGTLTLTGSGGNSGYTYSIDGGAYSSANMFGNLPAGYHSYSVQDSKACTFSSSITIAQPAVALSLSLASSSGIQCYGGVGNFSVQAMGGNGPYNYTIGTVYGPNNVFANIVAGNYIAKVQDANQCVVSLSVSLAQPAALTVSTTSIVQVVCSGSQSGSFALNTTGGVTPYTYSIVGPQSSSSQSSSTFSSLAAGNYSWTVRDNNMCTVSGRQIITQPSSALVISVNTTVACSGTSVANVSVVASGGVGQLLYSVGGAYQSNPSFSVSAGTYNVTVKDTNGCVAAATAIASSSSCVAIQVPCISWGDPHFLRFDGSKFDFQAVGDFVLAQWAGNNIQVRQQECSPGVTCNKVLAVQPAGVSSVILIDLNGTVTVGGSVVTVNSTYQVAAGVVISKTIQSKSYSVTLNNASVSYNWYAGSPSIIITLPAGASSNVTGGLCSSVGGDPSTTLSASWMVQNASVSLFTYTSTESFSSVNQPGYSGNYGPYSTNNSALANSASNLCSLLSATGSLASSCGPYISISGWYSTCYGDVVATGDVSKAQASVSAYVAACASRATSKIVFPSAAATSSISGSGLTTAPMFPSTVVARVFTIQTRDALGNAVSNGDVFTIVGAGPTPLNFSVATGSNGLYTVTYYASIPGVFNISVYMRGVEVVGDSQYTITVDYSALFSLCTLTGKALTWSPPNSVVFDVIQPGNLSQVWRWSNGRIVLQSQPLTMDINGGSTTAGTSIIAWTPKSGSSGSAASNQLWTIFNNGTVSSNLTAGYFGKQVGTSFVTSYAIPPGVFAMQIPA